MSFALLCNVSLCLPRLTLIDHTCQEMNLCYNTQIKAKLRHWPITLYILCSTGQYQVCLCFKRQKHFVKCMEFLWPHGCDLVKSSLIFFFFIFYSVAWFFCIVKLVLVIYSVQCTVPAPGLQLILGPYPMSYAFQLQTGLSLVSIQAAVPPMDWHCQHPSLKRTESWYCTFSKALTDWFWANNKEGLNILSYYYHLTLT